MNEASALLGATVRRVDAPFHDLLALTLHRRGLRGVLLLGLSEKARGVGLVDRRPAGRASSALLLKLKSCIEGGRIVSVEHPYAGLLRLHFERGAERFALEVVLRGAHGNALLRAADGSRLAALRPSDRETEPGTVGADNSGEGPPAYAMDLDALRAEGERLLQRHSHLELEQRRTSLEQAVRSELRRAQRRLVAIEGDIGRATRVGELRHHASLVLSHLHELPPDCAQAELLDYATDPPAPVTLRFDPGLGPKLQAETWFRRARKLERGVAIAAERLQTTRATMAGLHELSARAAGAHSVEMLAEIALEARALGAPERAKPQQEAAGGKPQRRPYRQFAGTGDRPILVGRGPDDNDRLTLDHARPHDLWLHVRDEPGAHVVVPLERDQTCPPDLLCDAATLAAHFSGARGQSPVDVIYTPRRYVHKPRKTEPGRVAVLREKVFRLQLEPLRLKKLLACERPR
jgi:predicted ribosome quality control (RQC) complex YloA/Tae2 family protein